MTESLHALSGAYVVDALDDEERELFERHLPLCVDCQQEVASLREATALMTLTSAITPPPTLRSDVLAGIKTIRPLPPESGGSGQPREYDAPVTASTGDEKLAPVLPMRRVFSIGRLLAAAAVVVAIVGGAVYQPWQDDENPPSATLGPADQVLAAFDAQHYSINFDDGSSASVVRSTIEGKAVLLTQGMTAPPRNKTFELWLRDKSGVMRPAGLMASGGDNKVLLKGNAVTATGVGITVEPKGGSRTPSSAPIAMFEFGKAEA